MRSIWAITTAALFSTTVGCVGYTSNIRSTTGAVKTGPPALSGLAPADLIRTKYIKAVLTCELRKQKGIKFNETAEPDDSISWDLINDYADSKTLTLKASVTDEFTIVTLNIKKISISSGTVFAADGKTYDLQYSPSLTTEFKSRTEIIEVDKLTLEHDFSATELSEGVPSQLLESSRAVEAKYNFTKVYCLLSTEAKPEYQGQFSAR